VRVAAERRHRDTTTVVAALLAIGLATALNIIVIAVLWDAVHGESPGLSENATQILTGWGGGIIGILGGIVGYHARKEQTADDTLEADTEDREVPTT
jgi:hypothetical protein